jgi:bifunctional UDP-N-acetylglucosamine pyrophosphorylase/glucosamine-1-phosphate N-acetyltransferase
MGLLTVNLSDPAGYGRIVRDNQQQVTAIVEHKDATPEQLTICEGNTGILAASRQHMVQWLGRLSNHNAQAEYYLTDIIAMAVADGVAIHTETATEPMEVQGANDRQQLASLERFYQFQQANVLMAQGVTLLDPARLDIRGTVKVGRDITIDINVILKGNVEIEDNVSIGANCVIKNSILRSGAIIKANCHIEGSEVGPEADCGPFARLRPGTKLEKNAHVGNFVELKNTHLGVAAKVGHLTYLGDSEIGARTNIGAGTITCNYDGANKHRTVMGEDVFIGSNSSIVAPITLGDAATTGAGSTITQDVPAHTLAIGRGKQRNIANWARPQKKS